MEDRKKVVVTSKSGFMFEVDTSDVACLAFGFRHGDELMSPFEWDRKRAVVMGVAPGTGPLHGEKKVLWVLVDGDRGRATYWYGFDLRAEGFVLWKAAPAQVQVPVHVVRRSLVRTTFKPLKGNRVRCNQTGVIMPARQARSYARNIQNNAKAK
jgi:hypothetical protein